MTKPITPAEVVAQKPQAIPPEVFEAFNVCIARHFNGVFARFTTAEVVGELKARVPVARPQWLDVEQVYRASGWRVSPIFDFTTTNDFPVEFRFGLQ